jgi:integral membrane protein (TIGR01906 family)
MARATESEVAARVPHALATLAHIILVVAIPVLLLVSPVYLIASPAYMWHEYGLRSFPSSIRFSAPERLLLSSTIVKYVMGRATEQEMATLRTDAGETALRDEEVQHLIDVRVVMDGFRLAHALLLVLALLSVALVWYSAHRAMLPLYLRQGVWIAAGLIFFIVLASVLNFDVFFTRFHQIFFSEGSWLFFEDDTLIQLYPLPLWIDAIWKIGVLVALEMALLYALAARLQRAIAVGQ